MQKATLEGRLPKMEHTKQIINKDMCRKRYSKSKENNNEEKIENWSIPIKLLLAEKKIESFKKRYESDNLLNRATSY